MASKREKLESRANELGLSFVPATTDDELQELINDFQNQDEESEREGLHYFKSQVAGLSIQIGDEPARDEQPSTVRFTPYEFFNEERGEHYTVGFLATDEQDALEVLADDANVEEISKEDYEKARQEGKRSKY